jgi:hypothetical protein
MATKTVDRAGKMPRRFFLPKSVSRRSDRTRNHKPVQSLAFGNRKTLPRDRPCLSLYERIPAGSAKDYERQFIAQKLPLTH